MAKRVTVMLDDDLDRKLHQLQAKEIQKSTESVSFSQTLNKVLRMSLGK